MNKIYFAFALLLLLLIGASAIGEQPAIEVNVRGVLVRSPGAFSERMPFLKVTQTSDGKPVTLLCKLDLPGDESVVDAIAPFMDQSVIITGELQVQPDVVQKGGSRKTDFSILVHTLKIAGEHPPIIGPISPDGRWFALHKTNGLWVYDSTTNLGKELISVPDDLDESKIGQSVSVNFSAGGKFLFVRQGTQSSLWRLPDLSQIDLQPVSDDGMTLEFATFSSDRRFLLMENYQEEEDLKTLVVFQMETGEESARLQFSGSDSSYSFLPDGRVLVVGQNNTLIILNMKTGEKEAL